MAKSFVRGSLSVDKYTTIVVDQAKQVEGIARLTDADCM